MFDPNLPLPNANITSAVLRGQFNGLKDLIDAVPTITGAQIDAVTTLLPGSPATANLSVNAGVLHLTLGIPRGDPGANGQPFANAIVDSVTTLEPNLPATVNVSFDGTDVHFTFGIPRGADGTPGLPGEVSTTDLNNGLANTLAQTSSNSNAVATLDSPMVEPEAEALRQKLNELINALRR